MIALAIAVCWFLVGLVILVGIGWLVMWVLGQMGIPVPPMVMKVVLLVLGLLCVIWFLTLVSTGGPSTFPRLSQHHAAVVIEHYQV